jgi:class 3 adenylate cyclase/tetratricopeptide (TPR) repeat protein
MNGAIQQPLPPDLDEYLSRATEMEPEKRVEIAAELQRELNACAAYIPSRLLHAQLAQPVPGRVRGAFWRGSLLFADLSGFTAFCERLSVLGKQGAEEVSAVVNELFNALVEEVLEHRGELLKFGGDALIAFFDEETLGVTHASAATLAALAMQWNMEEAFAALETRAGSFRLRLRVGVHSGKVFAAEVGDNNHIELVITGPEVNHVAQAQHIAAPGEVVISEQTARLLFKAKLIPRGHGFFQVISLPAITLPQWQHPEEPPGSRDVDMPTLERMARQVAALRPYLVCGLPRRYLDVTTTSEMGEFRPVSVLFANFFDFSTLLTLPGEDATLATAILNAYFCRAQNIVHAYGGIINKVDMYTHGDKLMALFGAPGAHEDDPLRAVHCAFDLKTALEEANREIANLIADLVIGDAKEQEETHNRVSLPDTSPPKAHLQDTPPTDASAPIPLLRQRIGINTDTVFAGRVGGSNRYEYTVMGPAVNLSARLMEVSSENTILVSPTTRSAIERHIATVEDAPLFVKGIAEPIIPARALEGEYIPPLHARNTLQRAPLVGRETELERLLAQARDALHGKGRLLTLAGDVGIGKTRLVEAFVQKLVLLSIAPDTPDAVPQFQIYTGGGQSFKQNFPYITLRGPLQQLFGLGRETHRETQGEEEHPTSEQHILARVEKLAPEVSHFVPVLSDVLGVPITETPLTRSLHPEQRHSRLQELVIKTILGAAEEEPILLVLDDVQWIDYASRELLNRLATAISTTPIFIVLLSRLLPLPEEGETAETASCVLSLEELSSEQGVAMLEGMLSSPPPPEMLPMLERTQGNPFFIEELVHALVASGALITNKRGEWQLTRPPDQVAIPSSIEGLIMARLDQLDEAAYELVQVASVIGYRPSYRILEGIYKDPDMLQERLQHLANLDILVADERSPSLDDAPTYFFRHAMLRDVAYEGILYSQRRELHRRVAHRIEALSADHLDESLVELTRHYTLAEEWEPAFRYNLAAGIEAQHRYANQEALELFTTALDMVPHILEQERTGKPNNGGRSRKTGLLVPPPCPLSPIIIQILELYERVGDLLILMGQYEQSEAKYQEGLDLANTTRKAYESYKETQDTQDLERIGCPDLDAKVCQHVVRLHRLIARSYEHRADYETAFSWVVRGLVIATTDNREELARYYLLGASLYKHQGAYEKSLDWARLGLSVAEEVGDTSDQALAHLLMGNLWKDRGELGQGIAALEQARTLLDQMKDANRLGDVLKNLGDAYHDNGRWRDAVKCYHQSLQISENIGDVAGMAHTSNNLATVMVHRGELQLASELYQYSSGQFGRIGSLIGLAITGCNNGEVLLLQGKPRDAYHLLRVSIASLERLRARNILPKALRLAAEATLALDDASQAREYASQSLAISQDLGMVGEEAIISRVMGQVALHTSDFVVAEAHLTHSYRMLEQLDNRYELGKVLYWQAWSARAQGQTERIAPLIQQAEHIFKKLLARHDLERVREFPTEV